MTGTPPDLVTDLGTGQGSGARASLLDSRSGRWRARLVLALNRLAVNGFALTGDPLARVVRGSPRTDVYAGYEQIRRRGDLARSRLGVRTVTSRAMCDEVLRDPRFGVEMATGMTSSAGMLEFDAGGPLSGSFVELDPPQHTRLRRLTAPAFRPKLIRDLAPAVEEALTEILDPLAGRDRFDLMAEVASPFPIAVISRLLGIPDADAAEFRRIGVLVGQSLDGVRTVRQAQDLRQARRDLEVLFLRLAAERRREPRDDVISLLAAAEQDGRLAARDLVATCGLLLVAGFETTVNLIGNGLAALQPTVPSGQALVADPGRAEAVVEEALRFDPPVQLTVRMAREDLELDGVRLGQGHGAGADAGRRQPRPGRVRRTRPVRPRPERRAGAPGVLQRDPLLPGRPAGPAGRRDRLPDAGRALARPDRAARGAAAPGDDDPRVRHPAGPARPGAGQPALSRFSCPGPPPGR